MGKTITARTSEMMRMRTSERTMTRTIEKTRRLGEMTRKKSGKRSGPYHFYHIL